MRMPVSVRREVRDLLQRTPYIAGFCFLLSVLTFTRGASAVALGAGAMLLAGVICAALLIFSWRQYRPFLSWLIWAVPGTLLVAIVFTSTLAPAVSTGLIPVLSSIFAVLGCGGLGFFGSLLLLRSRVERWLLA
jgi:hypothetical protein